MFMLKMSYFGNGREIFCPLWPRENYFPIYMSSAAYYLYLYLLMFIAILCYFLSLQTNCI